MREYGSNINLPSLDNLFSSEQERQDAKLEKIQILPLTELHPFRNHPFQVRDDDEMDKMVDSVKEYGVMTPAIVRPRKDGGYEIVAGHRRCHASQRAGVETMPCIVRDMDDDTAIILMVDSNRLSGYLYCADCGRRMTLQTHYSKKDGSVQYSYRCGGYASRVNSCTSHSISTDNVEALILSSVKRFSRFVLNDEQALVSICGFYIFRRKGEQEMMKQNENEMNFSVPLEIIKASEIEPKEVKWLWYPYIPFGKVTLLQGDPGDGKSKLMWKSVKSYPPAAKATDWNWRAQALHSSLCPTCPN